MYKKTINCLSCEVRSDVIVRQTNYDDSEELEVEFCPFCSSSIADMEVELRPEWADEE